MYRQCLRIVSLLLLCPLALTAQKGHSRDVITELPMPELFLQPIKYVAHTGTTTLFLRTEQQWCVDSLGNPLSPCLVVPYVTKPVDAAWITSPTLSTVVIPGKTLRAVLAFAPRFGPSFTLRNYTPDEWDALFQARLIVTLESPALPGGFVDTSFGDRMVMTSLSPGKMFADAIHYTREGFIGRTWLRDNLDLSEDQVNAFFDKDITVHVKVRVRAALLSSGSIYGGVMIQGY